MTFESKKVLICDDSILARSQLKDIIKSLGDIEVLEAVNGQAAVDTYKETSPDLVFLDIVMPVKDGIAAVKEIKEFNSKAHIIMASSIGNQKHLKEAIEAGARDFIQKPLEPDKIKELLSSLLGGER